MGGLRSKMLFGLIAYFGGFATAIYYLSPTTANAATGKQSSIAKKVQAVKQSSKEWLDKDKCKAGAEQFKERMQTAIAYAEEKAQQIVEMYKNASGAEQDKNPGADDEK